MREAFSKARSTLDEFLVRARSPSPGTTGYALKVAVSDGPNVEYFWVRDFSSEGSSFRGVLNNIPRRVMKHKLGDSIAFHREQIADWTFIDSSKNRMFGNFTACALLSKEPPLQAEKFKQQYGLRCD